MNRRTFLTKPATLARGLDSRLRNPNDAKPDGGLVAPRVLAGLEPYAGAWGKDQLKHLLRRTLFSFRKADLDSLKGWTMNQVLDTVLSPVPPVPSDQPIAYYNNDTVAQGKTWVNAAYNATTDDQRLESAAAWWISEMLGQGPSIQEKMTLFWHNHFVSTSPNVKDARLMYKQNALLRQNVLGNFKDMARQITFDPGMLRFLNGNMNFKAAPNENYGRELQELFTIGKGPEISTGNYTNYTEADVKAAARVLTGWKDNPDQLTATFVPENHDTSDKQFSAAYGNKLIKGGADEAGARREIDDLLTMIFNQQATAIYICRKIYRWFVYYEIDDATRKTVIEPMAQLLMQGNYEIKPVLRALFGSAHFHDANNVGCLIKNPVDFTIGLIRLFEITFPGVTGDVLRQYYAWIGVRRTINTMAMTLLSPPNVAGWPAYYQEPLFHELWINTDSLQKRTKLIDDMVMAGYQLPENSVKMLLDALAFVKKAVPDPSDPNAVVDQFVALIFPIRITADQRTILKGTLLGNLPDSAWISAWNDYIVALNNTNDPTLPAKKKAVEYPLKSLLRYMLAMPEYQLS